MRRTTVGSLAITLMWSGCTCTSEVTIAPPRVPQGGRAVAIAVAQSDAKRIVVASASGGLFRTFDGGVSFQHLDGFPTFAPVDVAIASLDPNVIIATAHKDLRTVSGGGIWRSADGGATWKRPGGWPPPISMTCRDRPEAIGISHMPLTRTFYVATDCGIAVSSDNGASFSMVVLDPTKPRVRAVLVLNRATGVAADDQRLWFLNGGTWQQASGGPESGGEFAIHALASPWWTSQSIFYHAGRDREVYFSTDAGATWEQMATLPHGGGREKFVRVGRGLDGDPTHFDVYFGDSFSLWRQAVTVSVPGGSNAWKKPDHVDHEDPADVAFTPGYEKPLMLASDGGVHLTPDNGRTWKLTGSNYGGFTALQIGEMTGRAVGGSSPHLDLYYGTSIAHEGAFLSADAANPAHVDGPVTGVHCGDCSLFQASPHLGSTSSPPLFHSAPDGNPANRADPPFQVIGSTYVQDVPNMGPTPSFDFFLTKDRGVTWAPAFSLPFTPVGRVKFAGNLDNPVAYVGVSRATTIGLFRVQDLTTQPTVRRADSTGISSLGQMNTDQAQYAVFGVDPSNPDHLLAPDAIAEKMKASIDGGLSWFTVDPLTTAVTDTGRFRVAISGVPFVTAIDWDPANTCHILVGTMQNGVIRSADGGLTWKRVSGSAVATYITSFYFPPSGAIWMSTYGRGLWTLSVDRRPPTTSRCAFPQPPGKWPPVDTLFAWPIVARTLRPFDGFRDSLVCATCTVVAVRDGWITDVAMEGNSVKQVFIRSGILVERDRAGEEVSLSVPNSYSDNEAERLRRLLGRDIIDTRRVRGLVLRGTQLVALVLSREELPFPAPRTPLVFVASAGASGVPSVVESGDSVAVYGYGFLAGTGARGVDILVGADTAVAGVEVRRDGTFSLRLPVSRGPGLFVLTVAQRDGKRLTVAQGRITVVAGDGRR
jgi:hypothetical protein